MGGSQHRHLGYNAGLFTRAPGLNSTLADIPFMSQNDQPIKPWGGRFTEATDAFVERFTASIGFDYRLYHHDINGSIAHATMLAKVGVLTEAERDQIIQGLEEIRA